MKKREIFREIKKRERARDLAEKCRLQQNYLFRLGHTERVTQRAPHREGHTESCHTDVE